MKKLLCLSVIFCMLMILPITANADDASVVNIATYINYDSVMEVDKRVRQITSDNYKQPPLYYGSAFPSDGNVVIDGMNFSLLRGTAYNANVNDSLLISSNKEIPLGDIGISKIGFIAASVNSAVNMTATLNFKNGSTETITANVLPITATNGTKFSRVGNALKYTGSGNTQKTAEDTATPAYLNAYFYEPVSSGKISSITFNSGSYFVLALSYVENDGSMSANDINSKYAQLENKTITNVTETEILDAVDLYAALEMAKDSNLAGVENIDSKMERMDNLTKGYYIYIEEKAIADYIEANSTYLEMSATSRTDVSNISDTTALEALKAKYEEAESFYDAGKNDELVTYLEYFNEIDEINVEVADKAKIEDLIAAKAELDDVIEIEEDIASLEPTCEGYEIEDLSDPAKLSNLEQLVEYYEDAKDFNETSEYFDVEYLESEAERLTRIKEIYLNRLTANAPVYVDLTPYLNANIIVNTTVTSTTNPSTTTLYNASSAPADGIITMGLPQSSSSYEYRTNEDGVDQVKIEGTWYNMDKSANGNKYKLSGGYKDEGNDAVLVPGNGEAVTIPVPEMSALKGMSVILETRNSGELKAYVNASVTVNYTDGTSKKQEVLVPQKNGYYTKYLYAKSTVNFGNAYQVKNGAYSSITNPSFMYGMNLDIDTTKTVASLTFNPGTKSGAGANYVGKDYHVLAISAYPVTTDEMADYLEAVAEEIPETDSYSKELIQKAGTVKEYYNTLKDLDLISAETDTKISQYLETVSMIVISVDSVEKVRLNKTQIKAIVEFSAPVEENNLKDNLSILKGTAGFTGSYTLSVSDDGKTAEIVLPTTVNGGEKYTLTISGELRRADNPSAKLDNDYGFTYDVPAYTELDSSNNVKNNSQEEILYYFVGATATDEDEKTLLGSAAFNTGSLTANESKPAGITVTGANVIKVIWDQNMKTISSDKDIKACTATVNKTADYTAPVFSLATNTLKVEGFTPTLAAGKIVNIKIEKDNGALVYAGTQKTIAGGYFCYELILSELAYPTSFNMNITLGGDDFTAPVTTIPDVYYSSETDRESVLLDITSPSTDSSEDIEAIVDDIKQKLGLDFAPANAISDEAFADAIYANKAEFVGVTPAQAQQTLKEIAIVASFNEDKANVLFSANGDFLHDDIIGYSAIDTAGVKLYELYIGNKTDSYVENDNGAISDAGKTAIQNALLNRAIPYATKDDIVDEVKAQIFLAGLNYPSLSGSGNVEKILTEKNAQEVGVTNISKYLGLSADDKSRFNNDMFVAKGSFSTVQSVIYFIRDFQPTVTQQGSTNSGNLGGNGGNGGGGGGGASPNNKFSTVGIDSKDDTPTVTPSQAAATAPTSVLFTDVDKSHWAWDSILSLYNKEIMTGKGNKVFDPASNLTRGELVKMLCVAYGLTDNGYASFSDTNGKWYDRYAAIAFANGLVTGVSEGIFDGDAPVTREQICTILWRAEGSPMLGNLSFADAGSISEYAKGAVSYMAAKSVVNGYTDGSFQGANFATRAEVAKILATFLKVKDMPVSETPVAEEVTEETVEEPTEETTEENKEEATEEVTTEETEENGAADEESAAADTKEEQEAEEATEENADDTAEEQDA